MKRAVMGVLVIGMFGLGCTSDATGSGNLTGGLTPARDITGRWEGSGSFTDNAPNPGCRWNGSLNPPSVIMNITSIDGNTITGSVRIVVPQSGVVVLAASPSLCTAIDGTSNFTGNISSSAFTFVDSGGNNWTMSFTTDLIRGTVTNNRFPQPGMITVSNTQISLGRPF